MKTANSIVLSLLAAPPGVAMADSADPTATVGHSKRLPEEVTIIGTRQQAEKLPGSAWVIDEEALKTFNYTDVNRVLAEAPGVYAIEEEGLGLRPNIGIRGSGTERSGKITLMEDGILVAPAPYADPSAYYFPTIGRMAGAEILKGAPLLTEGPYTVGGAINFLGTPIPAELGTSLVGEYGSNNEQRIHASAGGSGEVYGWLLETHQQRSDGFQNIDRSEQDSGMDKRDYMARFRLNTPDSYAGRYQQLDIKLGYAAEQSNASYLGLSDSDFTGSTDRRYGLTQLDEMDNTWEGTSAGYSIALAETLAWNITGYHNQFERDWFKVDNINSTGIAAVLAAANAGDADAVARLDGSLDTPLDIKHNSRKYQARGLQTRFDWDTATGNVTHAVQLGGRWHRDNIDRFQPVEQYQQTSGALAFVGTTAPTGSNNQEETARAQAYWLRDTLGLTDTVDLMLLLRYEDIQTRRTEYATPDRAVLAGADKQLSNTTQEWLPGIGLTWQATERWQLLGGVHRGMAPAGGGAAQGTDPELSINYEAGVRFNTGRVRLEAIGFFSDYDNSVRNCSVAFPCESGADSGSEQQGEAEIRGMEFALAYTPAFAGLSWPLGLSYTFTDTEITTDSDDGSILQGDALPYVPRNLVWLGAGVQGARGWSANLAARYQQGMCIDYTCGRNGVDNTYRETEDLFVMDLVGDYPVTNTLQLYARIENLFDEQVIVSRSPAGARPNKPRSLIAGLTVQF